MQIHELNNYSGNPDSGAYLAIDDGADTGKISAQVLLSGVTADIEEEATTRAEADAVLRQAIDNAAIVPAGSTVVVDSTLTISGAAADAKVTGDKFTELQDDLRITNEEVTGLHIKNETIIKTVGNVVSTWSVNISEGDVLIVSTKNADTTRNQTIRTKKNGSNVDTLINGTPTSQTFTIKYSATADADSFVIYTEGVSVTFKVYICSVESMSVSEMKTYVDVIKNKDIQPIYTTFFDIFNFFDTDSAVVYNDRFVNTNGSIASGSTTMLVVPVEPSTEYWFYAPNMNRSIVAESVTNEFSIGSTYTPIHTSNTTEPYSFTTGATAKYVAIYIYNGSYDYNTNKYNIVLNKNNYVGNKTPYISEEYLPPDLSNVLSNANILIFGDSITDCCNLTINSSDETTAYSWKNPSNSYVNAGGTTINYSMWAKILKESEPCGEIRNYAYSGASYKTAVRSPGDERQNLHYQIDVALNDLDNPNNVFSVANYVPNIVIFALGTNDGAPNDTYAAAMSKTVYQADGVSIDVPATISSLNTSKFCESARCAFMRIKTAFPMAQIYVVLPIQRADNDTNLGNLHDYLKEMAERYGCIIIDGAFDTGITRDFNKWNALGTYLKDGLHPNEKGQNLIARTIIKSLKSHYMPFGTGFNA